MARRAARAWASSTVLSSLRLTVLGVCVVSSISRKEEARRKKEEGRSHPPLPPPKGGNSGRRKKEEGSPSTPLREQRRKNAYCFYDNG